LLAVVFLLSFSVALFPGFTETHKEPSVMPIQNPHVWPSVEEQLAAAKVARGSALEKLIRDNQDFHMLRPEEANDKIGLPLWLRVYWRKQHPELVYSANDPTAATPEF
jgi:hypothetical protein